MRVHVSGRSCATFQSAAMLLAWLAQRLPKGHGSAIASSDESEDARKPERCAHAAGWRMKALHNSMET